MEHKAIYKCRLCGQTYASGAVTGKDVAERCMVELTLGIRGTVPLAPTMHETHDCGGRYAGSLGLADFQGWEAHPNERTMGLADYEEEHDTSGLLEED
jgi:hypothetical protein